MDRMSALRMASLWERRLSSTTNPDIEEDEVSPFDLFPKTEPLRQRLVTYKRPRHVSANKPPVPPPLAPGAITMAVEEVEIPESALEALSPVSSFISSEPSSPGVLGRVPSVDLPAQGTVWEEIERLREVLRGWDVRLTSLEQRNRELAAQVEQLGLTKHGEPGVSQDRVVQS